MPIPTDLARIIAYCIMAIVLFWIIMFGFKQRYAIVEGFKGKDKIWQFLEVVMVVWLILFPAMIITDVFLGFQASEKSWFAMEIIFTAAVAGKVGIKYSESKFKTEETKDKKSEAL